MKVCCGSGKPFDSLTEGERIGGCGSDHCMGPIEEYLYLQFCGKFDTKDCISVEDVLEIIEK